MSCSATQGIAVVSALAVVSYFFLTTHDMTNSDMLGALTPKTDVVGESFLYFEGANGFYAHPAAEEEYPGVVMIHEWWGLNDHIRATAKQLAAEGYRVLAVDLFGKAATTPDEARAQVSALNQEVATANLRAATAFLRERGATKMASLGWCFGGAQSLKLALSGEPLDATIIYYGQLVTDPDQLQLVAWPVLGIFGATDQSIPETMVNAFRDALTSLDIENSIHIYPGVGHAFANPSGANFAPEETKDAWAKTLVFLNKNLK